MGRKGSQMIHGSAFAWGIMKFVGIWNQYIQSGIWTDWNMRILCIVVVIVWEEGLKFESSTCKAGWQDKYRALVHMRGSENIHLWSSDDFTPGLEGEAINTLERRLTLKYRFHFLWMPCNSIFKGNRFVLEEWLLHRTYHINNLWESETHCNVHRFRGNFSWSWIFVVVPKKTVNLWDQNCMNQEFQILALQRKIYF